ncbi:MAG: hypothetical protein AB1762_12110, partial [Gemmatimonadota bacterium]
EDVARNLSVPTFLPVTNNVPLASPSGITRLGFSVTATSNPNIVDMIFDAISPQAMGPGPIHKAAFLGLPSDGIPRYFGKDDTPDITTVSGGTRFRYQLSFDTRDYCGPAGPVQVFTSALSADGKIAYKPNQFSTWNLARGANCNTPLRVAEVFDDIGWNRLPMARARKPRGDLRAR